MKFTHDRLTQLVISCIITVHQTLGPGFLESVYRRALVVELRKRGYPSRPKRRLWSSTKGRRSGAIG